eukprot:16155349-Heterocapsa_arctica.AAC.1
MDGSGHVSNLECPGLAATSAMARESEQQTGSHTTCGGGVGVHLLTVVDLLRDQSALRAAVRLLDLHPTALDDGRIAL